METSRGCTAKQRSSCCSNDSPDAGSSPRPIQVPPTCSHCSSPRYCSGCRHFSRCKCCYRHKCRYECSCRYRCMCCYRCSYCDRIGYCLSCKCCSSCMYCYRCNCCYRWTRCNRRSWCSCWKGCARGMCCPRGPCYLKRRCCFRCKDCFCCRGCSCCRCWVCCRHSSRYTYCTSDKHLPGSSDCSNSRTSTWHRRKRSRGLFNSTWSVTRWVCCGRCRHHTSSSCCSSRNNMTLDWRCSSSSRLSFSACGFGICSSSNISQSCVVPTILSSVSLNIYISSCGGIYQSFLYLVFSSSSFLIPCAHPSFPESSSSSLLRSRLFCLVSTASVSSLLPIFYRRREVLICSQAPTVFFRTALLMQPDMYLPRALRCLCVCSSAATAGSPAASAVVFFTAAAVEFLTAGAVAAFTAAAAVASLCMLFVTGLLSSYFYSGAIPVFLSPFLRMNLSIHRISSSPPLYCYCETSLVFSLLRSLQRPLPFSGKAILTSHTNISVSLTEAPTAAAVIAIAGANAVALMYTPLTCADDRRDRVVPTSSSDVALKVWRTPFSEHRSASLVMSPEVYFTSFTKPRAPAATATVAVETAPAAPGAAAPIHAARAAFYFTVVLPCFSLEGFTNAYYPRSRWSNPVSAVGGAAVPYTRRRAAGAVATEAVFTAVRACMILFALAAASLTLRFGTAIGVGTSFLAAAAAAPPPRLACRITSQHFAAAAAAVSPVPPDQPRLVSPFYISHRPPLLPVPILSPLPQLHAAPSLSLSSLSSSPSKISPLSLAGASVSSPCVRSPSRQHSSYIFSVRGLLPGTHSSFLAFFSPSSKCTHSSGTERMTLSFSQTSLPHPTSFPWLVSTEATICFFSMSAVLLRPLYKASNAASRASPSCSSLCTSFSSNVPLLLSRISPPSVNCALPPSASSSFVSSISMAATASSSNSAMRRAAISSPHLTPLSVASNSFYDTSQGSPDGAPNLLKATTQPPGAARLSAATHSESILQLGAATQPFSGASPTSATHVVASSHSAAATRRGVAASRAAAVQLNAAAGPENFAHSHHGIPRIDNTTAADITYSIPAVHVLRAVQLNATVQSKDVTHHPTDATSPVSITPAARAIYPVAAAYMPGAVQLSGANQPAGVAQLCSATQPASAVQPRDAAAPAAGVSVSLGTPKLRKKALRARRFKTPRIPYEPQDSIFYMSLLPSYEAMVSVMQQNTHALGDDVSISPPVRKKEKTSGDIIPRSATVVRDSLSDDMKKSLSSAAATGPAATGLLPREAILAGAAGISSPIFSQNGKALRAHKLHSGTYNSQSPPSSLFDNVGYSIKGKGFSFPTTPASQRLLRIPGMDQKMRRALWIDRHLTRRMKGAPSLVREAVVDIFLSHNSEDDIVLDLGPPMATTTATQTEEEKKTHDPHKAASPAECIDTACESKEERSVTEGNASLFPEKSTRSYIPESKNGKAQQATASGAASSTRRQQQRGVSKGAADVKQSSVRAQQDAGTSQKRGRKRGKGSIQEGGTVPEDGASPSPLVERLTALSLPGLLYLTGGEVKLLLARHVELLLPVRFENCKTAVTWLLQQKKWCPAAAKQLLLHVPRALSVTLPQVKAWFRQYETLFSVVEPLTLQHQQIFQQQKQEQEDELLLPVQRAESQQTREEHEAENQKEGGQFQQRCDQQAEQQREEKECQQLDQTEREPGEGKEENMPQRQNEAFLSRLIEQVALRVPMVFRVRRPLSKVEHFAKIWRTVRATRCEYRPAACWPSFSFSHNSRNQVISANVYNCTKTDRSNPDSKNVISTSKSSINSSTRRIKDGSLIGAAGDETAGTTKEKSSEKYQLEEKASNPQNVCDTSRSGTGGDKKQITRCLTAADRGEEVQNCKTIATSLQNEGQPVSRRESTVGEESSTLVDQERRTKKVRLLSQAEEDTLYKGYYELMESYVGNLNASEKHVRRLEAEAACVARARKREELALQQLFTRYPKLFTMKLERNVKAKLLYLQNYMMKELDEVLDFPQYLSYSLRRRIIPRHIALVNAYLTKKKRQRMIVDPLYSEGEDLATVIKAARTRSHWDDRMRQKQKLLLRSRQQRHHDQPGNVFLRADWELQDLHEGGGGEEQEAGVEKEEKDRRGRTALAADDMKNNEGRSDKDRMGRGSLEKSSKGDVGERFQRDTPGDEGTRRRQKAEDTEDEEKDIEEEEEEEEEEGPEEVTASTSDEEAQCSMYDAAYWERKALLEEETLPVIDERKGWRGIQPYQPFSMPPLPPLREIYATSDEKFLQLFQISYQDFVSAKVDTQAVKNPQSLF